MRKESIPNLGSLIDWLANGGAEVGDSCYPGTERVLKWKLEVEHIESRMGSDHVYKTMSPPQLLKTLPPPTSHQSILDPLTDCMPLDFVVFGDCYFFSIPYVIVKME